MPEVIESEFSAESPLRSEGQVLGRPTRALCPEKRGARPAFLRAAVLLTFAPSLNLRTLAFR